MTITISLSQDGHEREIVKCILAAYVAYLCNPNTQDTKTGRLQILGELWTYNGEILTQNANKKVSAKLASNLASLIEVHNSQSTYITLIPLLLWPNIWQEVIKKDEKSGWRCEEQ